MATRTTAPDPPTPPEPKKHRTPTDVTLDRLKARRSKLVELRDAAIAKANERHAQEIAQLTKALEALGWSEGSGGTVEG